jgi:phage tail sheath protein FI
VPEYLAPGVYVEEVSFRAKSIEGVSTTTTGFIGPTRYGPIDMEPDIITGLGEFERIYGDRQQLRFNTIPEGQQEAAGQEPAHNYMWHAVRAFFEEGGKRLYIVRAFRGLPAPAAGPGGVPPTTVRDAGGTVLSLDGFARRQLLVATPGPNVGATLDIRARFPGALGNQLRVRFTVRAGQNLFTVEPAMGGRPERRRTGALADFDVVLVRRSASPVEPTLDAGELFVASSDYDTTAQERVWAFTPLAGGSGPVALRDLNAGDQIRVVTVTVTVTDAEDMTTVWPDLPLDPRHRQAGQPDSLTALFAEVSLNRTQTRSLPIVIAPSQGGLTGIDVLVTLLNSGEPYYDSSEIAAILSDVRSTDDQRSAEYALEGGNDGARPGVNEYEGQDDENLPFKTGLRAFEDIEDISIVAAPGSTFVPRDDPGYATDARAITGLLISHAQRMRYRIAVLDSQNGQTIAGVRALRGTLDSSYAALYFPWVRVLDPVTRTEIHLPPSGFVAGIYARNDVNRAVYKAPANEVVNLALGFEMPINKAQQEVLNPEGINCFRFFEGRGFRLWGARTISSDPEWKYVNLRRYFAYLERSIDRGTQWAVFEPNGEQLWANVRRTVEDFLLNEWQMGALLGDKPERAYFVRCDRTTMTQNDLDNGRLVCLIGVAALRPAEFVIFRIGQWTADRRS